MKVHTIEMQNISKVRKRIVKGFAILTALGAS